MLEPFIAGILACNTIKEKSVDYLPHSIMCVSDYEVVANGDLHEDFNEMDGEH